MHEKAYKFKNRYPDTCKTKGRGLMARFMHLGSTMKETLSLGTIDGKAKTATVNFSKMASSATADIWNGLVGVISACQEHPVSTVKKASTDLLSNN